MLADLKVKQFLEETASNSPVPGGGSVAALSGALAASLAEMVAGLTVGRKGFESVEPKMKSIREKAQAFRAKLVEDIQSDSDAYNQVIAAYKLPKATEQEKIERSKAIQAGLRQAAQVPLEVARHSLQILGLAETVVTQGNPNALTDGAVGAMLARTAGLAALYNVKINLSSIKDKEFVEETAQEVNHLEAEILHRERQILAGIKL
ncbi:MAG: cyclodeaminase/cyclohydrolase family protein [Desulfoferrobacter sp.]